MTTLSPHVAAEAMSSTVDLHLQPRRAVDGEVSSRFHKVGFASSALPELDQSEPPFPALPLMHRIWSSATVFGQLAVVLGVMIQLSPSILVAPGVFGVYLVVLSIALMALTLSRSFSAASAFLNLTTVLAGIVLLAFPFDPILTMAFDVGIWLTVLGSIEVIAGFGAQPRRLDPIS